MHRIGFYLVSFFSGLLIHIVNMSSDVRLQRLVFCSIRLVYIWKTPYFTVEFFDLQKFVPLQISIY